MSALLEQTLEHDVVETRHDERISHYLDKTDASGHTAMCGVALIGVEVDWPLCPTCRDLKFEERLRAYKAMHGDERL